MKLLKVVGMIVVLLILLVVVGFIALVGYIDSVAKAGVERGGSYALGVDTTLDSISVGVFSGEVSMSGLEVGSPEGFSAPHFVKLGEGDVAVTLSSLREELVEVPRLRLSAIDLQLEQKDGRENYEVILDNVKKVTGGSEGEPAPAPPEDEGGKKFVVRDLLLEDITVHMSLLGDLVGDLARTEVNIEKIQLKDVGRTGEGVGGTGVTMSELSGIIVQAILEGLLDAGVDLPGGLAASLGSSLEGLGDLGITVTGGAVEQLENLGKEGEKILKEGEKALESIGEGLGGLLGGGDKKEDENNDGKN